MFTDPFDRHMVRLAAARSPVMIRKNPDENAFTAVLIGWSGSRCRILFPNGKKGTLKSAAIVAPTRETFAQESAT